MPIQKTEVKKEYKFCGIEHEEGKCHWILLRDDGRAIFGYPLKTRGECFAVMQMKNLSGYHPEHRFQKTFE